MHNIIEHVQDTTLNIKSHVQNSDNVSKFYQDVRKLHDNPNIDIHFNTNTNGLDHVRSTINNATSGVRHLKNSLTDVGHVSNNSFDNFDHGANNARSHAERLVNSGHRIRGVFSGTVLGNAVSNGFQKIAQVTESVTKSGFKLVEAGNEAREAWSHIGLNNGNANAMVNQMDNLRDEAGIDEQSIQRMQKSFYTFTGSAPRARTLVNEVADFGKASGESNQEITRMGTMLPRMLSTGKIRGQMFNRTFGQSGKLVNALAKASGHSASSFRQLVDSGKLTSQQLQQYMWKASKGSSKALSQYTHTFSGQMTFIKGMWTSAQERFAHPFVNNLTKSLNQTEKSAGGLKKVQKGVQNISASLGKHFGNYVGKAIKWIITNQRPLLKTGKALGSIIKQMLSGAWKSFSDVLSIIGGRAGKSSGTLNGVSDALTAISKHTTAMRVLGKVFLATFAVSKIRQFKRALFGTNRGVGIFRKSISALIHPQETILKLQEKLAVIQKAWIAIVGPVKAFFTAERAGVGIQAALDAAMDANPVGAIAVGVTAAVGAVTALVLGLHHLYEHCTPARHAMQAIGRVGVAAFKAITFPERMVLKFLGGIVKGVWHATSGLRHKLGHALDRVGDHVRHFYHSSIHNASKWGHEAGHTIGGVVNKFTGGSKKEAYASKRTHEAIDRYRHNSAGRFRAYISRNGKIYRKYHKGTTRISETTYKQRQALSNSYYHKYAKNLKLYETKYRKYEHKRSSLSRKYGKIRAMYSAKSLTLIENRFKKLRKTVVHYAKELFHDTQRIFRKIGTGAGKQFKGIYQAVRKYMRMSNTESKRDFKQLYQNSRRWLNGSINKYVKALQYRYKKQRYYDKQLVKQSKATGKSMYRLPLGWINRETKDLIHNWSRQRKSYITHNVRMTKAERTHLNTMTVHLDKFGDKFRKLMDDLEDNIYNSWSKFWTKMRNRTGSGINGVQAPLNSGAMHINSFVRSFGETTSPMHEMPEVSYATGTGEFRRPITRMVQATLNDGHDSPETNNQETVIHPNGSVEFPQGNNIKETLEPGTEVLNATETRLMGEMAHFAPTVHLATGTGALNNSTNPAKTLTTIAHNISNIPHITNQDISNITSPQNNPVLVKPNVNVTPTIHFASGTGLFGGLFSQMSDWVKNAINGTNPGTNYTTIYKQAKGSGYHKLLHILQKVLGHSTQVLSGFMGNAPSGYHGALNDITKGIYGQTSNQINNWWQALMKLTDQALNNGASSSQILNYAEKHWMGVPYVYGATSNRGADCGGAVQSILRHFGINISHTDMEDSPAVHFVGKSFSDARPGDLVMFGSHSGSKAGASSHVGIYSGHGQMWNECPPRSTISSVKDAADADGLWGFYRLRNAPSNNNDLSDLKTNGPLTGFVKRQESPMFKWIEKHLAPLLDPNPGGGPGVAKWRSVIEQAAEHMHAHLGDNGLRKVMNTIQHESNGDEDVTNHWDSNAAAGHASTGLVQFIPSTFEHYAVAGHNNIHSGYDQLLALFNDSNWFNDLRWQGGWGPTGSRKLAKGGHMNAGEIATVGEHGYELFKPDKPGKVIPHNVSKRILNRTNNSHPIKVEPHYTFNVSGEDSSKVAKQIDRHIDEANDDLADKLAQLGGFDDGGIII